MTDGYVFVAFLLYWALTSLALIRILKTRRYFTPLSIFVGFNYLAFYLSSIYFTLRPLQGMFVRRFAGGYSGSLLAAFEIFIWHYAAFLVVALLLDVWHARLEFRVSSRRTKSALHLSAPATLLRLSIIAVLMIVARNLLVVLYHAGVPGVENEFSLPMVGGALTLLTMYGIYIVLGVLAHIAMIRNNTALRIWVVILFLASAVTEIRIGWRFPLVFVPILLATVASRLPVRLPYPHLKGGLFAWLGIVVLMLGLFRGVLEYRNALLVGHRGSADLSEIELSYDQDAMSAFLSRFSGVEAVALITRTVGTESVSRAAAYASSLDFYTRVVVGAPGHTAYSPSLVGLGLLEYGYPLSLVYFAILPFFWYSLLAAWDVVRVHPIVAGPSTVVLVLVFGDLCMGGLPVLVLKTYVVCWLFRLVLGTWAVVQTSKPTLGVSTYDENAIRGEGVSL